MGVAKAEAVSEAATVDANGAIETGLATAIIRSGYWIAEDGDSYNLAAFDQTNGAWPIGQPLPLPSWSNRSKATFVVEKLWQYEEMIGLIETKLQRMLEETHYNTANNFVDFYRTYRAAVAATAPSRGQRGTEDLKTHFHKYTIPINRRHHMCVSLGMEIVSRIAEHHPDIGRLLYLVSCEEALDESVSYIEHCEENGIELAGSSLEKEHALVAMKILVGGREGVLILDPGYHVARAVTVMKDQKYPHTGWFTQSDEPHCRREYSYGFHELNDNYITWTERMTRGAKQQYEQSLVYIGRPYRTAIDVTVRRNLVYNFRSLLSRDAKGRVCAGLYFPVVPNPLDAQVTLFYDGPQENQVKQKFKFSLFKDAEMIPDPVLRHLDNLAPQLRMELGELVDLMVDLAASIHDVDFVRQVLEINNDINELSADN
ncbi:uncharacterized protein LOC126578530 [Anopheles aquasalis]|uniref:uncharacterized protein LOC126578530 n=1 Tax=Anopheles aquasalis TaxID=42839 RepID=UPI00215B2737|nr:uncharacterized protein LOC126578530 [Anopheles aquasalis]